MLASDFRVVSEGESLGEELSPERVASQLSLDSQDRGRIQNVLASTLQEATTTGFPCFALSVDVRGEAVLRIKPRLNALTLTSHLPEIPIPCISSIIVESALIKKINRGEFPSTDLSLIDGALGLEFDHAAGLSNILCIFDNPDQRRRCVALISLLRISPPHRRMTESPPSNGDSEVYEKFFHNTSPRTPSPQRSPRASKKSQESPSQKPSQRAPAERPTRINGITRSGRPTRTNMARSPLRRDAEVCRAPSASPPSLQSSKPANYFIDQHWRQYRSLSPEQRNSMRAGRRLPENLDKVPKPQGTQFRWQTPPPLGNRLCEMCMTPPPSRRYDAIDLTSDDLRPVYDKSKTSPTRRRQSPLVGGQSDSNRKLRPLSSSTQTTRVPDSLLIRSGSDSLLGERKDRKNSIVRRFPEKSPDVDLQPQISPKSQATIPLRFYSPMRTRQVRAPSLTPKPPTILLAKPQTDSSKTSGYLLGGDANACTRAINEASIHSSRSVTRPPDPSPAQVDNTSMGAQSLNKPVTTTLPIKLPIITSLGAESAKGISHVKTPTQRVHSKKLESKNASFTEYFDRELSETTDQVEILTTENTSTVIHARQLSRHPHEHIRAQNRALASPTIEEEIGEVVERAPTEPSATDESFDISASMITPSYIKRKTRRQLNKQAISPLVAMAPSPLSAQDESWRPAEALSPLDKLQLSRIGVPTPFTLAQMSHSANSAAAGAAAFQKKAPALQTSLDWR